MYCLCHSVVLFLLKKENFSYIVFDFNFLHFIYFCSIIKISSPYRAPSLAELGRLFFISSRLIPSNFSIGFITSSVTDCSFSSWCPGGGVRSRRAKRSLGVQLRCRHRLVSCLKLSCTALPRNILVAITVLNPILSKNALGCAMFRACNMGCRCKMILLCGTETPLRLCLCSMLLFSNLFQIYKFLSLKYYLLSL